MTLPVLLSARYTLKGLWLAAGSAAVLGVAAFGGVQTARIEGLKIWPVEIEGLKSTAARLAGERDQALSERDAEAASHIATKDSYREAQEEAARLEAHRLVRVTREQQEITNAVSENYRERLGAARVAAERLRREAARDRAATSRQSGAGGVPGLPGTAGRADETAGNDRLPADQLERDLIATEQAIQLDALIDWIEAQQGVDPNE